VLSESNTFPYVYQPLTNFFLVEETLQIAADLDNYMVKVNPFQTASEYPRNQLQARLQDIQKIVLTLVTFEVCFSSYDSINQMIHCPTGPRT
jgi:hypothetical protein